MILQPTTKGIDDPLFLGDLWTFQVILTQQQGRKIELGISQNFFFKIMFL